MPTPATPAGPRFRVRPDPTPGPQVIPEGDVTMEAAVPSEGACSIGVTDPYDGTQHHYTIKNGTVTVKRRHMEPLRAQGLRPKGEPPRVTAAKPAILQPERPPRTSHNPDGDVDLEQEAYRKGYQEGFRDGANQSKADARPKTPKAPKEPKEPAGGDDPKSALVVACPSCMAAAGDPCVSDKGKAVKRPHAGRRDAATAAAAE